MGPNPGTVPPASTPAGGTPVTVPNYVCDRCGMPAAEIDGKWQHAELADATFCALVMFAGKGRALQQAINDLGCGKPDA